MTKQRKIKISKIKRDNQKRTKLTKQGKLKMQRHRKPKKLIQKIVQKPQAAVEEEESDHGEDLANMVEEDDINFLKNAISNKSYELLRKIRLDEPDENRKRKKYKKAEDGKAVEEIYENNIVKLSEDIGDKKIRMLLPVKTRDGIIKKRMIEEELKNDEAEVEETQNGNNKETENSDIESDVDTSDPLKTIEGKIVSTVDLLACREEVLKTKRFKIGVLSSTLLENPENKSGNFKILLDFMEESNPEVYITIRKLATVSLLEIFKDLLPAYNILQLKQEGVLLKKETLHLQNYEAVLLKSYKNYLQKLEKMAGVIRKRKGDTRILNEWQTHLGELAVKCMCDLLVTHAYFNFSTNIASFLVPLLDSKYAKIREMVSNCISQIFKEDKRGDLSLMIVRKINQYIKSRSHSVHTELVSILLSLRIKDINLDKEKEEEVKQKKLMSHKQRILALSKRERKKSKKLELVEKELLETKAEENKVTKQKVLTEIMSVVFTIYFRVLKQAPNNKILSSCLEGLAKFAHSINLDFYQDLVAAIDKLMEGGNLGLREQLHCVQCVFTILSGQGSTLNIDPYRFYVHLYRNLLNVHAGRTQPETEIVLKTLVQVLIGRRKGISQPRLIAFVKRMATLSLQLQHNGSLGVLGIVKQIMQLGKAAHILLDTDSTAGDGFYQPEVTEPEYCNAHCTALWELAALQRHYHVVVRKVAKNIAWGVPTSGEGSLDTEIAKLTPEQLYTEFDPSGVAFKPAVPVPKKTNTNKKGSANVSFGSRDFEDYVNQMYNVELFADGYVDFYKSLSVGIVQ